MEIKVARWTRLELATPAVTGRYSNQLNYHRTDMKKKWWSLVDSNHWHPPCKGGALPTELSDRVYGDP